MPDPDQLEDDRRDGVRAYRRVGHKGADAIVTGNTAESFDAATCSGPRRAS
jgi:hypothetical protein